MKSPKPILIFLLLTCFSTNALAVCDHERREYEEWSSKCEKLSAASEVAGAAGGLFLICTFGLSMVPCGAAALAARNACRIRDEKQKNLSDCEAHQAHLAKEAQDKIRRAQEEENARQARIKKINNNYTEKRDEIIRNYDHMIRSFVAEYAEEGWDMEDPDSQEHIRTTRSKMERERDKMLDQLESDRKKEVANA